MNETDIDALTHRRHRSRALTVAMRVPPREYERSYKELQGVTSSYSRGPEVASIASALRSVERGRPAGPLFQGGRGSGRIRLAGGSRWTDIILVAMSGKNREENQIVRLKPDQ